MTGMEHAVHSSKIDITLHSGAGSDSLALRCSKRQGGDGASLYYPVVLMLTPRTVW